MRWYCGCLPQASEDIYAYCLKGEAPPADAFAKAIQGKKICGLLWCCLGPKDKAEAELKVARKVAEPLFHHVGLVPYRALQCLSYELYPPGFQWHWKGDFVRNRTDEAIAGHQRFAEVPTGHSLMRLYPINGAVHRAGKDETAWSYRDANWPGVFAGVDPDAANKERITKWARDYWEALHPHSTGAS